MTRCTEQQTGSQSEAPQPVYNDTLLTGAQQTSLYLPLVREGRGALVVNHTSLVERVHLLDTLLSLGVSVERVFAPEHGFRGQADAGALIKDGKDSRSGIPIISLYGSKKKPAPAELKGLDWVIFDIQDVGVRFYTYLGTLHYVMEACAEQGVRLIVLDRPNPNGHYIDGPLLDTAYRSFVGMHPVPVVHGMTVCEYAQMIKGEEWIKEAADLHLTIIPCAGYRHDRPYSPPVPPSPNLPNDRAILLYASLCLFEGTTVSLGRGTGHPFQLIGHPALPPGDTSFIPEPRPGAMDPPQKGKRCQGHSFAGLSPAVLRRTDRMDLSYLLDYYKVLTGKGEAFFLKNLFFDKLAGGDKLRRQIIGGMSEAEIRASWQEDLSAFRQMRQIYMLYP